MATVNGDVVKRSLALDSNVEYQEGLSVDFKTGVASSIMSYLGLLLILTPPLRSLLLGRGIPTPGTGPSLKVQQHGFLRVQGEAVGDKGGVAKSCIYFDRDPGYRETARMVCESGLTLLDVADGKKGGVYTPAGVVSKELLDRLCKSGTAFAAE